MNTNVARSYNPAIQFVQLVSMHLRMYRAQVPFIMMVQCVLSLGLVFGFGYLVPNITRTTALFLVTGTATQALVTVGLVMLPQFLSEAKQEGRLDYFLTLPISREAYLLTQTTVVAVLSLPGIAFSLFIGALHYDISLSADPTFLLVIVLSIFSLAGIGVAMAIVSPHMQVTNALTQLIIFYVLFFAPVLMPKDQLPSWLASISVIMPPTYAADAVRGTLTNLPGTHVARSLWILTGFGAVSLALSAVMVRRRG